jgi:hypothetical protein
LWIVATGVLAAFNAFGLFLNRSFDERDRSRRTVPFVLTASFFSVAAVLFFAFLWKRKNLGRWLSAHPAARTALAIGVPLLYLGSGINVLVMSNLVDGAQGWTGVFIGWVSVALSVAGFLAPTIMAHARTRAWVRSVQAKLRGGDKGGTGDYADLADAAPAQGTRAWRSVNV